MVNQAVEAYFIELEEWYSTWEQENNRKAECTCGSSMGHKEDCYLVLLFEKFRAERELQKAKGV